jgi:hypothetical protein
MTYAEKIAEAGRFRWELIQIIPGIKTYQEGVINCDEYWFKRHRITNGKKTEQIEYQVISIPVNASLRENSHKNTVFEFNKY